MLSVGNEELWIDLLLVEHHKDRRVADIVYTAVIQKEASIYGGRQAILRLPSGIAACQHAAHKHGAHAVVRGVAVGVAGIPGKVASYK